VAWVIAGSDASGIQYLGKKGNSLSLNVTPLYNVGELGARSGVLKKALFGRDLDGAGGKDSFLVIK
jgi:hypothetical protein